MSQNSALPRRTAAAWSMMSPPVGCGTATVLSGARPPSAQAVPALNAGTTRLNAMMLTPTTFLLTCGCISSFSFSHCDDSVHLLVHRSRCLNTLQVSAEQVAAQPHSPSSPVSCQGMARGEDGRLCLGRGLRFGVRDL